MACAEWQASTTPTKVDMSSTDAGVPLYPNWIARDKTKPAGRDAPRPYQMPKEDAGDGLMLEEELDAASVFDPLKTDSQSGQPDTQGRPASDSTLGADGLRTLPHYSEMPAMIPSFDLARVGVFPKMSPVTDREDELLNLVPGSPITCTRPTSEQSQNTILLASTQAVYKAPHSTVRDTHTHTQTGRISIRLRSDMHTQGD